MKPTNYKWKSLSFSPKIITLLFLMIFSGIFLFPVYATTENSNDWLTTNPVEPVLNSCDNSFGSNAVAINPYLDLKIYENSWMNNQKASEISSKALLEAKHFLERAYDTELTQIDLIQHLENIMQAEGADSALSFSTIVYSGKDHQQLHGNILDDFSHVITPAKEPIVTIDLGSKYQGRCSDVTRTYFFESATQEMLDAYQVVLDTQNALLEAIKPGVAIYDLDLIYRNYLADYLARDDVYIHPSWGHGVGEFVHEYPTLSNKTNAVLVEGQVLAVEPGIFFFDESWSVRVEDTVMVTASGVEIFSEVPAEIEDVLISPDSTSITAQIVNENYTYAEETTTFVYLSDLVQSVFYHDGYNWYPMEKVNDTLYNYTYSLDYSYSGLLTGIVKVNLANKTFYFSKKLELEPDHSNLLERKFRLMGSNASGKFEWTVAIPKAAMIRAHFREMNSSVWDQLVIIDKQGRTIYDFRTRGYLEDIWSPWIAGTEITIRYFITSRSWIEKFEFTIDRVEYITLQGETNSAGFAVIDALTIITGTIVCLACTRVNRRAP
ncbi:MAG: M24 family metallopeptidase [Candidatus Odinarchaeota archaeon]